MITKEFTKNIEMEAEVEVEFNETHQEITGVYIPVSGEELEGFFQEWQRTGKVPDVVHVNVWDMLDEIEQNSLESEIDDDVSDYIQEAHEHDLEIMADRMVDEWKERKLGL